MTPTRMKLSTSTPAARIPAGSVQRTPSIHSIVNTLAPEASG
jgi:hypothetical protein